MRTDTFSQGQRRQARLHWWRQVLDRPTPAADLNELFDEMVNLRFRISDEAMEAASAW